MYIRVTGFSISNGSNWSRTEYGADTFTRTLWARGSDIFSRPTLSIGIPQSPYDRAALVEWMGKALQAVGHHLKNRKEKGFVDLRTFGVENE